MSNIDDIHNAIKFLEKSLSVNTKYNININVNDIKNMNDTYDKRRVLSENITKTKEKDAIGSYSDININLIHKTNKNTKIKGHNDNKKHEHSEIIKDIIKKI